MHVRRRVHLTVAIGDAGEVERSLLQAKGGGFVWLPVPKQFEDIERAAGNVEPEISDGLGLPAGNRRL
jgi:hypothetical protein